MAKSPSMMLRAASVTPGPNNIMVTANAAQHGIRRTIPHILGIAMAMLLVLSMIPTIVS